MTYITVDFEKTLGPVKPMHGVGQPPMIGTDTQYFRYLSEANIPYSRLHDVGGWFGGNLFADIPNIFRDFDADADDPASYDFIFTDLLISALMDHHCEPIFRLGITIENFHDIKPYRCFPPKDFLKWARICEHIIRHYNEGWANGFFYGIRYWEIWNEPDGHYRVEENAMWKGTPQEYYDLYSITSRHLRACFGDSIRIGGYASCGFYHALTQQSVSGEAFGESRPLSDWEKRIAGFIDFFDGFLKTVTEQQLPLDFFSHHSYASVRDTVAMQRYAEKRLADAGLGDVEIHLNEWNANPRQEERGRSVAAACTAAMMCAMQNTKAALLCYYDARIGVSVYGGLFHPMTYEPLCTYDAFRAFGKLYALGTQVKVVSESGDVYVLAARGDSGKAMLLSNIGEDTDLGIVGAEIRQAYLIDEEHSFEKVAIDPRQFRLLKNQVLYLEVS